MKNLLRKGSLPLLLLILVISVSHGDEPYYEEYSEYSPVLMYRSVLESSIEWQEPRDIINPGKMYFKDDYILINEKYYGIHVVDNHDPANPKIIGFLKVPGNIDMSMKYNTLYVDNTVDLVAIDVSDVDSPKVKSRIVKEFPELTPPGMDYIPYQFQRGVRPDDTEIIRWEPKSY
jgi:hypothetical protein